VLAEYGWGMRIFFDPRAAVEPSYKTLPRFQRLGAGTYEQFSLRSGWDATSALVTILAGDHYTDHQHFDKGQFLIYHGGGLAVDSGVYWHMYEAGKHSNEYAPRTLAHNCLLVYDPEQRMPRGASNDGGQTMIRGKQHHADWPSYLAHRESEGLHTAEVEASDLESDRYAYVRANLRNAYGGRVERYDRQFVFIPEADLLVVFDRVASARAGFQKRWLLHFEDQPSIDGTPAPTGVKAFPGGRLTEVRRQGALELGGPAMRYDGSLSVETLLPEQRSITTVGGDGFEFYNRFTETNYPVTPPGPAGDIRESGRWRIEVAPERQSRDDVFLHVLRFPAGESQPSPRATLVRDASGKAAGMHLPGAAREQIVLFNAAAGGSPICLPLEYRVTASAPSFHLVTGLPPSVEVLVRVNRGSAARHRVNAHGVLPFEDRTPGRRAVEITAAPDSRQK
jgi:heparin/heparan-sulfate lyase